MTSIVTYLALKSNESKRVLAKVSLAVLDVTPVTARLTFVTIFKEKV